MVKWSPATHARDSKALPSSFTDNKVHSLVQCFQKGPSASQQCSKSNNTCNICREKWYGANECLKKTCFTMNPCSKAPKPHGHSSRPSRCPEHEYSHTNCGHSQEGHGEQQANKQSWKCIHRMGTEFTKLVNGHHFHWCSRCTLPHWSTTHSTVMHTNYSLLLMKHLQTQLLVFDTHTWVIDIPVHNM